MLPPADSCRLEQRAEKNASLHRHHKRALPLDKALLCAVGQFFQALATGHFWRNPACLSLKGQAATSEALWCRKPTYRGHKPGFWCSP